MIAFPQQFELTGPLLQSFGNTVIFSLRYPIKHNKHLTLCQDEYLRNKSTIVRYLLLNLEIDFII